MIMKPDMIASIRSYVSSRKIRPIEGLCEFIDNSLSAGATKVNIIINNYMLEVSDNGKGTWYPEDILTPFKTSGMDATSKYGIGAAGCAIVLSEWGKCVSTSCVGNGVQKTCTMDWGHYQAKSKGDVEITKQTVEKGNFSASGTVICIDFTRNLTTDQHSRNIEELAFRYSSALRNDTKITYEHKGARVVISPWSPPELSKKKVCVIKHPQFGSIPIMCGIVKSGKKNERPGFNVYWGKRILIEQESGPCAVHEASTARIYGEIILDHNKFPHVNTLKDGFNNDFDPSELWEQIANVFKEILISAKHEGVSIELELLSQKASSFMNRLLGGDEKGKEKRDKKDKPGNDPADSKKTDRTRVTAEKVSGCGNSIHRNKSKGFPMKFNLTPNETQDESIRCQYNPKFWDIQFNPNLIPRQALKPETLASIALVCVSQAWAKRCEKDEKGNYMLPNFGSNSFEQVTTALFQSMIRQKELMLV